MKAKTIRYLDAQGRVILPSHIRNALNLKGGSPVEVTVEESGTIRIRPALERCAICGEGVENGGIKVGPYTKYVCCNCRRMIKEESV